jgi:hypothetical protein
MNGICWKCRERSEHWDAPTEDGRCYVCHGPLKVDETELLELLHDIVAASDSNNGETLMNCIESARELLDRINKENEVQS